MTVDQLKTKIVENIFHLEAQKGHLKWSVTQIAQAAKISRSLVYYHFGKTKIEILINCLEFIGQEFYGLTAERQELSKASVLQSLILTNTMYKQNTSYAIFYQKWRHRPSPIQDKYLEFEKRYDQKLKENFPRATPDQRVALHAIFHGLVTAPFITEDALNAALLLLKLDDIRKI